MASIDLEPGLTADRAAVIMFDALNGYLHPADEQKEANLKAWSIRENMQRLIAGAHDNGLTVFYPSGSHAPDGSDHCTRLTDTDMDLNPWGERTPSFSSNITAGSEAAQVAPEVAPGPGDVVVPKKRWSSFYQTHLEIQLRCRGIKTVIIAGGSSDVGVISTAYAARDMDYGIVIVQDCCYSHRGDNNQFLMERIFPRMSRVMMADDAVALMKG